MKLVDRVSFFFLAALSLILVIFSSLFYMIIRGYLVEQFHYELQSSLHSLVAAVEVEPEEVKWQPMEHTIAFVATPGPDYVRWIVIGDQKQIVEQSNNTNPEFLKFAMSLARQSTSHNMDKHRLPHEEFLSRRLVAPAPVRTEREFDEFDEILIVVSRSTTTLDANLHLLSILVTLLPLGASLCSVVIGRWFCQRALQPVREMSLQAQQMTNAKLHARLPVGDTNDELSELAKSFNKLLDSRHQSFEQQQRFTGNAAHELRTPITILSGQIDVALRRERSPEEYVNTLRVLRSQSDDLQRIVESLLFLARADDDALVPHIETFDARVWLKESLESWKHHARYADLKHCINESQDLRVASSPALFKHLLNNLIDNAFKYSVSGSNVDVYLNRMNSEVLLRVEDHGQGIAAADLESIFTPFYRTQSARVTGISGTGLGLAIVQRIAAVCGFQLNVTSDLGRGTCFTLSIPAVDSAAEQ
jgi:heavy metal sensor kinase